MAVTYVIAFNAGLKSSLPNTPMAIPTQSIDKDDLSNQLFDIVNKHRISKSLSPFVKDEQLCEIAKDRSDDGVLDNHKGFHEKYDPYKYDLGENLVYPSTPEFMLYQWLQSKDGHKEAIESTYKYSCVACDKQCSMIFSNL